ncbi:MAG: VOC family protein [Dehalococcoidia bacterium]
MNNVTAYLCCDGAAKAIDFYSAAFGAEEVSRWPEPDGRLGHAEMRIGETTLYLSDEFPQYGAIAPKSLGGTTVAFVLSVDDVDGMWTRAVAAGATIDRPLADSPVGRGGWLRDPFGHRWNVMTPAAGE